MRWKCKGHELDNKGGRLVEAFCKRSEHIWIFGAGLNGAILSGLLDYYGYSNSFLDNAKEKTGTKFHEKAVSKFEATNINLSRELIIIAVSKKNEGKIQKQLEDAGLKYGRDYFLYHEFIELCFPVISVYVHNKSYVPLSQICVTERCSLKCKKCAHACYMTTSETEDMTIQEVFHSADSFFAKVDYINEFVLIGGEPFLYRDLATAMKYIGTKYRNQINVFSITTNGSILPSEEVLEACRQYHVLIRVSNYSVQVPRLEESYRKLVAVLQEYQVEYILGAPEWEWMDYGFEYVDRGNNPAELSKVFARCKTPCKEVRGNKLYYCVMARSVSDNLQMGVGQEDYLDLDSLNGDNYKKELLEFSLGYSEKGYLDMCRHCHGADAHNYPIPAAEQL